MHLLFPQSVPLQQQRNYFCKDGKFLCNPSPQSIWPPHSPHTHVSSCHCTNTRVHIKCLLPRGKLASPVLLPTWRWISIDNDCIIIPRDLHFRSIKSLFHTQSLSSSQLVKFTLANIASTVAQDGRAREPDHQSQRVCRGIHVALRRVTRLSARQESPRSRSSDLQRAHLALGHAVFLIWLLGMRSTARSVGHYALCPSSWVRDSSLTPAASNGWLLFSPVLVTRSTSEPTKFKRLWPTMSLPIAVPLQLWRRKFRPFALVSRTALRSKTSSTSRTWLYNIRSLQVRTSSPIDCYLFMEIAEPVERDVFVTMFLVAGK